MTFPDYVKLREHTFKHRGGGWYQHNAHGLSLDIQSRFIGDAHVSSCKGSVMFNNAILTPATEEDYLAHNDGEV